MKNEIEKLSKKETSAVTQHKSIDLSQARNMKDVLAVREKLNLVATS